MFLPVPLLLNPIDVRVLKYMKKIALSGKNGRDKFVLVDNENYKLINKFKCFLGGKYVKFCKPGEEGKHTFLHKFILPPPKGFITDHRDGNTLNCQRNNLRIATQSQNIANSKKRKGEWTSSYKGVHLVKYWKNNNNKFKKIGEKLKPWVSGIKVQNKSIYIGQFKTEIEAALAYNEAAVKHFGKFAKLNIIN